MQIGGWKSLLAHQVFPQRGLHRDMDKKTP